MITNTLEKVRSLIWASMAGISPEEWQNQRDQQNLKSAVDKFLEQNPNYLDNHSSNQPVRDSKQKARRIRKSLGADAGKWSQEHGLDPEQLRLAREKCRQIVAENPDQYSHVITAATAPDGSNSLVQCLNRIS